MLELRELGTRERWNYAIHSIEQLAAAYTMKWFRECVTLATALFGSKLMELCYTGGLIGDISSRFGRAQLLLTLKHYFSPFFVVGRGRFVASE